MYRFNSKYVFQYIHSMSDTCSVVELDELLKIY